LIWEEACSEMKSVSQMFAKHLYSKLFMKTIGTIFLLLLILWRCSVPEKYDVLIRNGQILDSSGLPFFKGDIGINADTIAKI